MTVSPSGLLRGPRRVLRLCVFVLVLPAALITIPLYVRLVLYPPAHYPMMPTDQRLLSGHVSSFWCQVRAVAAALENLKAARPAPWDWLPFLVEFRPSV